MTIPPPPTVAPPASARDHAGHPPANPVTVNPAPGWPAAPEGFTPRADWEPDPDWPAAPPGWPRLVADRAVERARFWRWPHPVTSARQAAAWAADRRPTGWEIWLVLAIFPGVATIAAIDVLIERIFGSPITGGYVSVLLPDHPHVSAALNVPRDLLSFAPALLVAYLLAMSGGGLTAIGLDRASIRGDLARGGKLFFLAFVLPFSLAGIVLSASGYVNRPFGDGPSSPAFLVPLIVSAFAAGVTEEIVVLGYLVHRLEQRGWSGWRLVGVCVAVRASYHLYYGVGVLGIVGWATVSVLLYRRRRRLLVFIVIHALWDSTGFVVLYLPRDWALAPYTSLVGIILTLFITGRRQVNAPG